LRDLANIACLYLRYSERSEAQGSTVKAELVDHAAAKPELPAHAESGEHDEQKTNEDNTPVGPARRWCKGEPPVHYADADEQQTHESGGNRVIVPPPLWHDTGDVHNTI